MPDAEKLFETLVREHADMLTVYLTAALGDISDVDDLFQETMIVAWRRLDDFDQTRPFGAWLRGIARNLLLAHFRKNRQRLQTSAVLDQLESRLAQIGLQEGDTWQEKLLLLKECVLSLPEHYRDIVTLRYFEQQAIPQVSKTLAISMAAAKKRLQRARLLVLNCMKSKLAISEL